MQLAGKKALITGGRRRIGRGIALALAAEGCDVGVNDIERDEDAEETLRLIRDGGREADFFLADLANAGAIEEMFDAFLQRFGRIDIHGRGPEHSRQRQIVLVLRHFQRLGANPDGLVIGRHLFHSRRRCHGDQPSRIHDDQPYDYPNLNRRQGTMTCGRGLLGSRWRQYGGNESGERNICGYVQCLGGDGDGRWIVHSRDSTQCRE